MADGRLFSRDEIVGGLPARRASTLLFAIEALTAQLAARRRRAMATYLTERTAAEQERGFLEALRAGREERHRPSIRDLERHAPAWSHLVPDDPPLRAAVAAALAGRHAFRHSDVPRLRAALGLDEPATHDALARQSARGSEPLFVARLPLRERMRWARARIAWALEDLPPFWAAFALTLTETVGGGVLALPIALAGLGLGPAIALIVAFGLVSTVTLAALVEAITRNGSMRYGTAYLGRLVADHLGRPAAVVLGVALAAFNVLALMFVLVGVGVALDAATPLPAAVWVAAVFAVDLAILRRDSLDATVASALVIGAINILIVLILIVLALAHFDLAHVASGAGAASGAAGGALVFGVLLAVYFGHTSAGNAAKVVLGREPSGRGLLRGNVAAMVTVTVLYCLVTVAFTGAIDPARLAGHEGTVIEPLADRLGPVVSVLGSIYAVLAMGLSSIYLALGLANQTRELLADRAVRPSARWGGTAMFAARSAPAIAVFAVVEALILAGAASFAGLLSFLGSVTVPLVGGIFPMLLVLAARRRGEYVPGSVIRPLAYPVVVAAVALVYLAGVVVHALFVATSPAERAGSAAVVAIMVVVAAVALRRGSFRPRAVIELRREPGPRGRGRYRVANTGRAVPARVELLAADGASLPAEPDGTIPDFDALRSATVVLPRERADELLVWTHAVTAAGDSVPLPAAIALGGAPAGPPSPTGRAIAPLPEPVPGDEAAHVSATIGLVPEARTS